MEGRRRAAPFGELDIPQPPFSVTPRWGPSPCLFHRDAMPGSALRPGRRHCAVDRDGMGMYTTPGGLRRVSNNAQHICASAGTRTHLSKDGRSD